jgi:very-short-patch-repair endonuclease
MQGQRRRGSTPDWFLRELAERQHGVFAWWQLRLAGLTRGEVDSRLARGLFRKVHRGVYAFGHRELTQKGWWMAAVLALGEHAVLSHRSAAALWGMLPTSDTAFIHVAVAGRPRARRKTRIMVHHRHSEVETTVHDGIPVTTVEATLLDLSLTVDRHTLGQAVAAAERLELFDRRVWTPPAARPGASVLREVVGAHRAAPTRSELERRFLELCREHHLPMPKVNVWVAGAEVDFYWPVHRLVVETDGGTHAGREVTRDYGKEAKLALAGIRTHRFAWEQVVDAPVETADVLSALMGR